MQIKITTLSENTATFQFLAEWGLAIHIDIDGFKILLDTGMGQAAVYNAALHNIDFKDLNAIVLSHGHLDHTGGLKEILKLSGGKKVIAHPNIFEPKFSSRRVPPNEEISMPFSKEELESLGANFLLSKKSVEICPNVFTSGQVPMINDFEHPDNGLLKKSSNLVTVDSVDDDLSLAIKTSKGLFAILGCAHRGPVNIISHLLEISGESKVYAIVGGTHLVRASSRRIEKTIDFFKKVGVKKIACCHCTGFKATARIAQVFGGAFIENHSGTKLTFDNI